MKREAPDDETAADERNQARLLSLVEGDLLFSLDQIPELLAAFRHHPWRLLRLMAASAKLRAVVERAVRTVMPRLWYEACLATFPDCCIMLSVAMATDRQLRDGGVALESFDPLLYLIGRAPFTNYRTGMGDGAWRTGRLLDGVLGSEDRDRRMPDGIRGFFYGELHASFYDATLLDACWSDAEYARATSRACRRVYPLAVPPAAYCFASQVALRRLVIALLLLDERPGLRGTILFGIMQPYMAAGPWAADHGHDALPWVTLEMARGFATAPVREYYTQAPHSEPVRRHLGKLYGGAVLTLSLLVTVARNMRARLDDRGRARLNAWFNDLVHTALRYDSTNTPPLMLTPESFGRMDPAVAWEAPPGEEAWEVLRARDLERYGMHDPRYIDMMRAGEVAEPIAVRKRDTDYSVSDEEEGVEFVVVEFEERAIDWKTVCVRQIEWVKQNAQDTVEYDRLQSYHPVSALSALPSPMPNDGARVTQSEHETLQRLLERARTRVDAHHRHNTLADTKKCLVCGQQGRVQERLRLEHVFCGATQCHAMHWQLDQFFGLGMPKRLLDLERFSDVQLPDEILCYLLLLAFDARLQSREEYDALFELRATSIQFRRVIDDCVVPQIRDLGDELVKELVNENPIDVLLQFHALRRLKIAPDYFTPEKTDAALAGLSALQELYLKDDHQDDPLVTTAQLAQATQLTKLTIHGSVVGDAVFESLTHLTSLTLYNPRNLTGMALIPQTQLQTLVLQETERAMDLSTLSELDTLVLDMNYPLDISSAAPRGALTRLWIDGPQASHVDQWLSAQSRLEHLLLYRLADQVTDAAISRLTGLRSLVLDAITSEQVTPDSVSLLTNLQALLVSDADMGLYTVESFAPLRASLTWLGLSNSATRFPAGAVVTLRNLTHLDLNNRANLPDDARLNDDELGQLVQLHTLDLSYNAVITGRTFNRLAALTALSLRANRVVTDDALIVLASTLRVLDITGNTLVTAASISRLLSLRSLFMQGARHISAVPLQPLSNLQHLVARPSFDANPLERFRAGLLRLYNPYKQTRPHFPFGVSALPQWQFFDHY
jgi:Leucine-rich repeat (LRR) protein